MKINAGEIRVGMLLEYKDDLWQVLKTQHVKPGKGGAFAQVELRDIRDGTKLNERFRATESVERVILEEIECTYLYSDGYTHIFMHAETFEQISIASEMIGDAVAFLQDGMVVSVATYEDEPISATLPEQTTVTIIEADAVVKGQTASSSYKPAIADNGVRIMVPPFIETGTRIVVKIEDSTYVERAKD